MVVLPPQPDAVESLGDFEVTDEIEARINALARRARDDVASRNALYEALSFKIARFARRCSYRLNVPEMTVCQPDDVGQEAFLIFCDLVEQWPGNGSFLSFFLSVFPKRLSRAVDVLERGCTIRRDLQRQMLESLARDEYGLDAEAESLLVELGGGLSPRERLVLELHVIHDLPMRQVGRILGLHVRTVFRIWQQLAEDLRANWPQPRHPA
jgi:RNA polymerase sigma factor (sigma-70 family)